MAGWGPHEPALTLLLGLATQALFDVKPARFRRNGLTPRNGRLVSTFVCGPSLRWPSQGLPRGTWPCSRAERIFSLTRFRTSTISLSSTAYAAQGRAKLICCLGIAKAVLGLEGIEMSLSFWTAVDAIRETANEYRLPGVKTLLKILWSLLQIRAGKASGTTNLRPIWHLASPTCSVSRNGRRLWRLMRL